MRRPRAFIVAAGLVFLGPASIGATTAESPPRRIVSLNLCADQLIVALADRGQIAALTQWSRDPQLSFVAQTAASLPITHHSAEEVLALRPDLVIGAPFRTKALLARPGAGSLRMIDLPGEDGVGAIEASITQVATAVGHPERGATMIAAMRRELATIGAPPGRGRLAAYYQPQGYLTGTGTLIDDMMRRVGLVNLARRLDRPALSRISLEEMAMARPDFLLMDAGTRAVRDLGTAALHHRVLDRATPSNRRLYIPQALTVCGGPAYPRAVAMLARQIRAADRRAR